MPTITTYTYKQKKGTPRPGYTYRAARRNLFLRTEPRSTWPGVPISPQRWVNVRMNRSRRLDRLPTLSPYR